jgi:type II secretory pathway component PulF
VSLVPQATASQRLMAFNDELLALVRVGIPLDRGLQFASRDMSGQLRRIMERLVEQLERGKTLDEALRDQPDSFPAAYRALLVAGQRTGQLASLLAKIAESMKRLELLRQTLRSSLAYPFIILALAYGCFVVFASWATPGIVASYWDLVHRDQVVLQGMTAVANTVGWWWPVPPLLLVGLWKSGSSTWLARSNRPSLPRWKTPWRRIEHLGMLAVFTEILAIMVEHEEPLPSALVLAGEAAGNNELNEATRRLAERMAEGHSHADSFSWGEETAHGTFPPLLVWLLVSSRSSSHLGESLHRFSRAYQRQAERLAMTLSFIYPVIVGTLVAGTAVLAYAVWVTLPWYLLLYRLGDIGGF